MPGPSDAYPHGKLDGQQILLDLIRFLKLDYIDFTAVGGTVPTAAMLVDDQSYVFYSTQDCILHVTGTATKTPNDADALFIPAGERISTMLPVEATGFSVIGLTLSGRLYIQRIETWAGIAREESLGNG